MTVRTQPIRRMLVGVVFLAMSAAAFVIGWRFDTATSKHLTPTPLETINAPTLIISARDDGYGTYASARYTASRIPSAKFIGFERGGHTWVGHNDEIMARILKLLVAVGQPTRP